MADGPFALILCRNLAFTYFAARLRTRIAGALAARLAPGGVLIVGVDEVPPGSESLGLAALGGVPGVYVNRRRH
jgi:chemotaxis protein methyltransferase CheR